MSETKFTPGPWVVDDDGTPSVIGPDGFMTADCAIFSVRKGFPTDERCLANAHLVAAAPDLYAALEILAEIASAASQAVRGAPINDDCEVSASMAFGDLRRARAALKKARGETP